MKKRVVSVLLAVCMCFQMLPVAFADDSITSTVPEQSQEQESTTDGESLPSSGLLAEDESQALKEAEETDEAQATATPIPTEVPENTEDTEATSTPVPEASTVPEEEPVVPETLSTTHSTEVEEWVTSEAEKSPSFAAPKAIGENVTIVGSGNCGRGVSGTVTDDLVWTEYSDGRLVIEGEGYMADYNFNAPWSSNITDVSFSNGVASIGDYAFCNCSKLTEITTPESLLNIGDFAFYGCTGIKTFIVQGTGDKGVGIIGAGAFENCTSLESIILSDIMYDIGYSAFARCSSLESIIIPNGITCIENYTFLDCINLKSVTIPDGVTRIGIEAFAGCENLANIDIPDGMIVIDEGGFTGCKSLTNIDMPDSVKSIGYSVFESCSNLTSIHLSNSLTSIGGRSFEGCSKLTSIELPNSVTSIGMYAFVGLSGLTDINIPSGVTSIGEGAFSGCSGLKGNITIPDSITNIEKNTFSGCSGLSNIIIPNGVVNIGEGAFSGCSGLTGSITIPNGVTSIEENTFSGCSGLTNIVIPSQVLSIGEKAFSGCAGLVDITIPSGVTSIEDFAFSGCSGLKNITIPQGVTSIGYSGFDGCSGLTSITIPDSVTSIGDYAFRGCSGLTSVMIPDSVTSIGYYAFGGCSGLTNITIPDGVTGIKSFTFSDCSRLTSIMIPDSVISIENSAFSGCSELTSITIPDGVTSIANSAFSGCSGLTSIMIPDGVTSIGGFAFYGCSELTDITIPASITSIGDRAFDKCDSLKDVYFTGNEDEWNAIAIGINNSNLLSATIRYSYSDSGESPNPDGIVSSYHIGLLEKAEGDCITIDGTEYKVSFADLPVIPTIMVGQTVVYGLNNDNQVVVCSAVQTVAGKISQWDAQNSRFFTDIGYCEIKEGVTDSTILQDPESFIGLDCCVSYVSLSDGYTIVNIQPVTTITGTIENVDVLSDPWKVYLSGHDEAYTVDMTDETLQVALTDLIGQEVVLTLVGGKIKYAYTPAQATSVQVRLNIAPSNLVWSNEAYNIDAVTATLTILYNPAETFIGQDEKLSEYLISVDQIDFSLDGLEMLTFADSTQLQPGDSIAVGESRQYEVKLRIPDSQLKIEPEDGLTGTFTATIQGKQLSEPLKMSQSAIIGVTNEDVRNAAEKELEQTQKEASQEAYDAIGNITDKMTLPIELTQYVSDEQLESLKVILLSEIALANSPKEVWRDKLSDEITEKVLSKFLGYKKPDVTADATEIPVSVVVETEQYGSIQIDFLCDLTEFSLSGNKFAIFGSIETSVKLLEKKGSAAQTFQGGMIAKCDINSFAEGVWSVASAQLQSGYNKVWGNDANKIANNLMQAGVEKVANKVSPYFFQLPVEQILQQLYEHKFKDKFSSTMYKILCAPSKIVAAHCPVDLLIYDSENSLVASIENNEITRENENVALWTEGDSKYVQLFDNSYTISYRATGSGTMDVEITEEANDVSVMRIVSFVDVPLGNGILYAGMVDDTIQPEENVYALQSNLGTVIVPTSVNKPVEEPMPSLDPVVITPSTDLSKLTQSYVGSGIDVTQLFEIDGNAGAATYTLLDGGTGTGSLTEDGNLTVTKAGNFVIQVDTAATDTHAAGSAQVTMTVNKGRSNGTLQVTGSTYPAGVQPAVQGNLSGGSVTYYYNTTDSNQGGSLWTTDTVLDAGEYWMYAEIAATDLYEAYTTSAVPFTVQQAVVDQLDLANLITAPVRGATPQTELTTSQFAGTILWSDTPTVFAPETVYTATVKLTAAQNYTLEGLKADSFQYAGAEVHYDPMANQLTIVFPATDGRQVQSFAVTGTPSKTTYDLGEAFDVTGLTMTVTYDDGTIETITSGYRVEPATMAADTTQVVISYGGVKAEPVTGLTVRENLVSIQAPQAITGLANGTEKTTEALGLPKTVKITTSRTQRAIAEADVTWDLDACSYDPAVKSEQTFVVQGLVSLPQGMTNLQNVPLTVAVEVTVKAAESKPTEPENPGDTEEKPGASNQPAGGNETPAPTASANAQSAADDTTKEEQNQSVTVPQTGDPTPITVLVVLMAVSLAGILALSTKRKKNR